MVGLVLLVGACSGRAHAARVLIMPPAWVVRSIGGVPIGGCFGVGPAMHPKPYGFILLGSAAPGLAMHGSLAVRAMGACGGGGGCHPCSRTCLNRGRAQACMPDHLFYE